MLCGEPFQLPIGGNADLKKALIVRNGTSGRFTPIGELLKQNGWTGAVINGPFGNEIEGWVHCRWSAKAPTQPSGYAPVVKYENALRCGGAAAQVAIRLRDGGFVPDVIIGHPSWGEMLFLSEVWRGVPQIHLGEYYYHTEGGDSNFDPEFPAKSLASGVRIKSNNAVAAMSFLEAAAIVVPTPFQASLIPADFHHKLRIIHEGVDTGQTCRRPPAPIELPDGKVLAPGTPVISFVNRRFEPMRGFHVFMRMLPKFLSLSPNAHVLLIGADERDNIYGVPPPGTKTWREAMLAEVGGKLPNDRVHFSPPVPYESLLKLLSNVTAHVYLTYPFVLSWSLLDAMACEALVVGSDTAPVRDVIQHGKNGLLVDFFETDAMAETLAAVCADPARYEPLRRAARETVVRQFDRASICMPDWLALIEEVVR